MTRATPSNTDDDKPVVLPAADVYYFCWYCMRLEPTSCDRDDCPSRRYPPPDVPRD